MKGSDGGGDGGGRANRFFERSPERRRRMLCCAGCNKNFLIKSLTCTAADLLASLWDPFVSVQQRSREILREGGKRGRNGGKNERERGDARRRKDGEGGSDRFREE